MSLAWKPLYMPFTIGNNSSGHRKSWNWNTIIRSPAISIFYLYRLTKGTIQDYITVYSLEGRDITVETLVPYKGLGIRYCKMKQCHFTKDVDNEKEESRS